jgi:hypothetical protein
LDDPINGVNPLEESNITAENLRGFTQVIGEQLTTLALANGHEPKEPASYLRQCIVAAHDYGHSCGTRHLYREKIRLLDMLYV